MAMHISKTSYDFLANTLVLTNNKIFTLIQIQNNLCMVLFNYLTCNDNNNTKAID